MLLHWTSLISTGEVTTCSRLALVLQYERKVSIVPKAITGIVFSRRKTRTCRFTASAG